MKIATLHVGHHSLGLDLSLTILGDDDVMSNDVLQMIEGPDTFDHELTMRFVFRKSPGLAKWKNRSLRSYSHKGTAD